MVGSIIYPGKNTIYKNEGKNAVIKVKKSKINECEYLIKLLIILMEKKKRCLKNILGVQTHPTLPLFPFIRELKETVCSFSDNEIESIAKPEPLGTT